MRYWVFDIGHWKDIVLFVFGHWKHIYAMLKFSHWKDTVFVIFGHWKTINDKDQKWTNYKEMFYLTMHSKHFIYGYMASVYNL